MAAKFKVLVINGPNLNMLGKREPDKYGVKTLAQITGELNDAAAALNVELAHFQSNSEAALIEHIHDAWQQFDSIIINPAAFTHTSVALRDALLSVDIPFFEVHLSNIHQREPFRHHSYFSDVAQGVICGFGAMGYHFALQAAVNRLQNSN
ncbi:type II 3-dehydroquinate dehydratase [Pseudoalteromonas sp. CO325X]|uniref:type II 3-dehydroquinate dehydratase n=1 Tax=unclassified Pseudoalteromonas TaxID=194690 RepID=UPI0006B5CBE5|nr:MULTISPECIES: type II 3-dehydroquinate dehydratase [unclassified Pseudoalteromonas]RZF79140.1 type II 3-dehydroquinate dehydratase [Pseudoalteromonas sp. CO325X]GAP74635.1 3-dehydroquinate dehydratase II [Pseudoalteromonas sp. SW0106-04]